MPGAIDKTFWITVTSVAVMLIFAAPANAQDSPDRARDALTEQQWQQVDKSVDRALAWIGQQQQGGAFHRLPAITSLCVLAFLSNGHLPGEGPYGLKINAAIDHVLAQATPDGQIVSLSNRSFMSFAEYQHPINGLMLCEVYGMTEPNRAQRISDAIKKAINYSVKQQARAPQPAVSHGGWRYWNNRNPAVRTDLSITSWHLLFLRSAKNAGFEVPVEAIDQAMAYFKRSYDPKHQTFCYALVPQRRDRSRAMAGAGILGLSLGGLHDTPMAQNAGDWLLRQSFQAYNRPGACRDDRFHYSVFYSCLGMKQLGGDRWQKFYPPVVTVLLANQNADGSWAAESNREETYFGQVYTTSLMVLSLTAVHDMLPIFQR